MIEGLYISSELAANWMPWVCLAMVGLVWLSCMMQPQYMRGLLSNSFAVFSLNTAEQVPSVGSQVSQWLFNSTVPAVSIYILLTQSAMYGMELLAWLLFVALVIDAARALTAILVIYTFRMGNISGQAYLQYFSLRSVFTYVLFIIMMLFTYSTPHRAWLIAIGCFTIIYLIFLGIQWARLLCASLLDVVSLVIYLITIELLPMVLLFEAGKQLYL